MEKVAKKLQIVEIEEEMKRSYIDYAMSVIIGRALPDVRDGLKPVQRRILYAMHEMGMFPDRPYKKCARIVGEVLGKYHPHGDAAVYETLVRMAQDFSFRYPLIDGHGNFGSIDGDAPAAMRYTEARLSPLAMEMLRDIDKNTVNFVPNFDESLQEPSVLPSRFPNLLVNGSNGIAVGMSTNIPPHNLNEVIEATVAYIENPDITVDELMQYIKGPDFPTGGIIVGKKGIKEIYRTGKGSIRVRAKYEIEETSSGKSMIVIKEIPYQVNKARIIEKIAELVRDKKITEIADLRDESDQEGIRVVIELKREAVPKVVLNKIIKHTQLETTFNVIMLAIVDGVPKTLDLKGMIAEYVRHQQEIIVRRSRYELEKAESSAHIVEGLLVALANIDEVVEIIKTSKDPQTARNRLIERFDLTEIQAQAILDMRLQRLTQLETSKLQDEYAELLKTIEYLRGVLADPKKVDQIIIDELNEIKNKYGDERRTAIASSEEAISIEDLIPDTEVAIIITDSGYIKRVSSNTFKYQQRGGKGVSASNLKDGDWICQLVSCTNHKNVLFFTNYGKVYRLKAYQIPEASRTARGISIRNLLPLAQEEKVVSALTVGDFDRESVDKNIVIVTRNGLIKKTALSEFASTRRDGLKAITLNEGDVIVQVRLTKGDDDLLVVTRNGMSIRFHESDVRRMGRGAAGVKAIELEKGDEVLDMVVVRPEEKLLLITENGYGKRTSYDHFNVQRRGGKGLIAMKVNEKTGRLAAARGVEDDEEVLIVTAEGQAIRVRTRDISEQGRYTMGVRVMKVAPSDKVTAIAIID
jgi:DNA gyrase subunit A